MRRRIAIFVAGVLALLLVLPVANILLVQPGKEIRWRDRSFLYNADLVASWASALLYPLGISISPGQVVIGREGWLYLGDRYGETLSVDRRPASEADRAASARIGEGIQAWDAYLAGRGVKLFRIMVGPNKGTIYPEYLPAWATPASPNATDVLLAGPGAPHFVDLRQPLLEAKAVHAEPLYFKTDTHWNGLGASVAFHHFAAEVGRAAPGLQWPAAAESRLRRVKRRAGGDLAGFLRLKESLPDANPVVEHPALSVATTRTDFRTGKVLREGGNPRLTSPKEPRLIHSPQALNKAKVLWLRDSFGTAMSPWMAATFSDVVQLHWKEAIKPGGSLVRIVDEWKPDYVFVTVVERNSRNFRLGTPPPRTD